MQLFICVSALRLIMITYGICPLYHVLFYAILFHGWTFSVITYAVANLPWCMRSTSWYYFIWIKNISFLLLLLLLLLKRGIFSQSFMTMLLTLLVWLLGLGTKELKNSRQSIQNTYSQYIANDVMPLVFNTMCIQWAMCVFRHARLIMREICTMPVPFYTHVNITYFQLNFFFSLPGFSTCSILLFNELNTTTKPADDIQNFSSFICFYFVFFFALKFYCCVLFIGFGVVSLHLDLAFVHCQRGNDEGS